MWSPSILPLSSLRLLLPLLLLFLHSTPSFASASSNTTSGFDICQPLTFGILCWTLPSTTTSSISLSYQLAWPGYIAVAFSPSGGMLGSTAVIGWTDGAPPYVNNFDLVSQSNGGNSPSATLGLTSMNVTTDGNGTTTLTFTRPLVTPTLAGASISLDPSTPQYILESHGDTPTSPTSVAYHGPNNRAINRVSFVTGAVQAVADPLLHWKRAHAALMAVAFGFLIPLGILFARFFKGWGPRWFHLHRTFVLSGLVLVIAGFVIAVNKLGPVTHATHRGIGIYVVAAMLFQPLNAIIRPPPPGVGVGEKSTTLRLVWQALHHWNARVAYVLAIVNVYIGFDILDPAAKWVVVFSVLWGAVMLVGVVLQVWVIYERSVGGGGGLGQGGKAEGTGQKRLDTPASAPVAVATTEMA